MTKVSVDAVVLLSVLNDQLEVSQRLQRVLATAIGGQETETMTLAERVSDIVTQDVRADIVKVIEARLPTADQFRGAVTSIVEEIVAKVPARDIKRRQK